MKSVDNERELRKGFETAAISSFTQSNLAYRPEFLSNNPEKGRKVLASIEQELSMCDSFKISVAFITKSGITPLLQVLSDLERKNIPGKILTTDYLSFSEPEALEKLAALKNIELKMFRTDDETGGFHTKGYIFRQDEIYRIIIGSSNMTLSAVTKNREWNTKFVSTENGEMAQEVLSEFEELWSDSHALSYRDFIEQYKIEYLRNKLIREQRKAAIQEQIIDLDRVQLTPNKMQVEFVNSILELRAGNVDKAMLLSATGTGKTYASAFAMKELKVKRILFIVHREQIARQARQSYMKVFGSGKTYGLLSGTSKQTDSDFLFSTMQMMAKEDVRKQFGKKDFDVIILDECHRSGAKSYQNIMDYFEPAFWLGMTASPDTNTYDIYSIFDHNIAYEIRLQQALEEDLLCPFHYFGITDLEINGEVFDDDTGLRNFERLVDDQRVKYVIEKAEYFGHSGERLKGLIFCSSQKEARQLSDKFNQVKKKDGSFYKTMALTGEDSQDQREKVIARLTDDVEAAEQIDYILTVDIFNEGVDIPEINQVIMLRPTESPIVFIQQLGRGLRKAEGKEYVVILDFIGNYTNNFMIPIALSGDRSYNKDALRRYVQEGTRVIPGSSTIHFDEIAKTRIFSSIDSAKTQELKLLRESYCTLKYKLGRIPRVSDFKKYGSIDITKFFDKFGSYYAFLKKYEADYSVQLSSEEEIVVEYFSKKLTAYKRVQEIALLKHLISKEARLLHYKELLLQNYQVKLSSRMEESVMQNLTNAFPKEAEREKYKTCVLVEKMPDGEYCLTKHFREMLNNTVFRSMLTELLDFAEDRWNENYSQGYKDTSFQLYQKYNYEDVCRLLCWSKNMNAQNIGGYFYESETKTLPVFINYDKADDAIAYEDRFVSESQLIALSKHPRNITSQDAAHIYKLSPEDADNRIFLFVRKNKDDKEAKEFYFLGEIYAEGSPRPIHMETTDDDAFEIDYRLDVPVRSDIYDYIVNR